MPSAALQGQERIVHKGKGKMTIFDTIIGKVSSFTGWPDVTESTRLRDDLDSLRFVRLMAEISNALGANIFKPDYFLHNKDNPYETVGGLIRLAESVCNTRPNFVLSPETIDRIEGRIKPVKIIFTDLDGTLWDGVAGEDAICVKNDLVKALLELEENGVLLVSISKNYEETAKDCITPCVVLNSCITSIWNCTDKAAAIRDTCKRLNLGLNSAVFLDDSEHERDRVRTALPEVRVYDDHMDIAKITVEHVTDEDRRRTEMYRQEFERESSKPHSDNDDDYMKWLESLGMELTVKMAETDAEKARAKELFERCNQFKWNNNGYVENAFTYVFSLKDKFGDMGIIAAAQFGERMNAYWLCQLCISCRVLGRRAENVIFKRLSDVAWVCEPEDTGKNRAAMDFWESENKLKNYPIKVINKL